MKIPSTVKVGAIVYDIAIVDQIETEEDSEYECGGICREGEALIEIARNQPQLMERVFLHEVAHAILANFGYIDHDEQKLDMFAAAVHALIVDNPGIFTGK